MSNEEKTKILAGISPEVFLGRSEELDRVLSHLKDGGSGGLSILAAPGVGLTELLRQVYDRLFYEQGELIPVYFQIKQSDETAEQLGVRFLQSFLQQTVAFRRGDPQILKSAPDVCEVEQLSIPSDGHWIDRLVETCELRSRLNDTPSFIRQAFSAPLRAAASGANSIVLIDDLQNVRDLGGGAELIEDLKEIYSSSTNPFVFGGKRRYIFGALQTGQQRIDEVENLELKKLSFIEAGHLAENLADHHGLKITEQTRDLIAQQFRRLPLFLNFIFQTADERGIDLDTFQKVEEVYSDALFGGKIRGYYDSVLARIAPSPEVQKQLLVLLNDSLKSGNDNNPVESWKRHISLNAEDFYKLAADLNIWEVTRKTSNLIDVMREDDSLCDYIESRFRMEIAGEPRSLVVAESLSRFLKRAPAKMARFYRRRSALGIRELMSVYDCQETPLSLLDYEIFRDGHKGKDEDTAFNEIKEEQAKLKLPQIVYTAHTVSLYPPISKLADNERSAVALGFEAAEYKDENEIVWIAAEIDSKLEANEELTAFWCDRLEMVALMCDFSRYRIWLIAPEGFTPKALEVLKQRDAFGSSRAQVKLLARFLGAEHLVEEKLNPNEYEMVLPMGDDTELIAAYAVEEIARRHSFSTKAINQMKTALVEACINATEHSHSPDRKIYQKFTVEEDRITITISNRGLRFKGNESKEIVPSEGRRGWGLKLIKTLMDDVKFEQVDDGTRISMTKSLAAAN